MLGKLRTTAVRAATGGAFIGAMAGAAILAAPAASAADIGDGQLACNTGEICFFYYSTSIAENSNPTRHFWYSDYYHEDDTFNNRGLSGVRFHDNSRSYRNRDTACSVRMYNEGVGYVTMPRDGVYRNFPSGWQDVNNWHVRC
ncbi:MULTISPECIES: hypothetical protein [Thermomonospora]|uniref:Peptidase inhibitor family I36 n=1 Tax=Thermomonospora cellulosilytica TaxID=1411118 RepID=A0A7W3N425_9ACTN|nr:MULTISPECIES: hypothetical protein [Thermomonospora]MBA9007144.1 hypothetical protein [Thermomonospora cellulosilytica]